MTRARSARASTAALVFGVAIAILSPLMAAQGDPQRDPQVGRLALQTVKKVAKTDGRRILIAPLSGCLSETELCSKLDAGLRAEIEKLIPNAEFILREEALRHLSGYGFLSIDAYLGALDNVAGDAGVEVVISEDFQREKSDRCVLRTRAVDSKHHIELGEFNAGISCPTASPTSAPSVVKDPGAPVYLVLPDAHSPNSRMQLPVCVSCPDPRYSGAAREERIQGTVRLLITVTEQGTVRDARALGAPEETMALASLDAVNTWQLRPATGADGKPFAVRVPVQVTFRLMPRSFR